MPADSDAGEASGPGGALPLGRRCQLRAEEVQLAGVGNDMDRLDELAAHREHEHAGEPPAGEGEHRGLTADWKRHQRGAVAPESQQVLCDKIRSVEDSDFADPGTEIDIAPDVRGEYFEQAAKVAGRACGDELLGDQPVLGG